MDLRCVDVRIPLNSDRWPWHPEQLLSFSFSPKQICVKYFCEGGMASLLNSLLTLMEVWISRHLKVSWFQKMGSICVVSYNSGQAAEPWRDILLLITVTPRDPVHDGIRSFREAEVLFYFYFWYIDVFWLAFIIIHLKISWCFSFIKKPWWLFCCGLQVPRVCAVCLRAGVSIPASCV